MGLLNPVLHHQHYNSPGACKRLINDHARLGPWLSAITGQMSRFIAVVTPAIAWCHLRLSTIGSRVPITIAIGTLDFGTGPQLLPLSAYPSASG